MLLAQPTNFYLKKIKKLCTYLCIFSLSIKCFVLLVVKLYGFLLDSLVNINPSNLPCLPVADTIIFVLCAELQRGNYALCILQSKKNEAI